MKPLAIVLLTPLVALAQETAPAPATPSLVPHDANDVALIVGIEKYAFVEKVPGGIRILPQPNSMFRRETHGVIIGDLKPFQVAWGADFEKIRFNEYGKPKDMDGEPLTLVSMPTVQSSGQNYTFMLVSFHNQILEKLKAASKPATP